MTDQENQPSGGITLVGLGCGKPGWVTREAWDWLKEIDTLYLRTKLHPLMESLPSHLQLKLFEDIYQDEEESEMVYDAIIEEILRLGKRPEGVTYAVPGHPFVAEPTCPEIARRAKELGINLRVIDGVSYLEPTFRALGIDPFPELSLTDAIIFSTRHTPNFPTSSPALITQITSKRIAAKVKVTLMAAYPGEHLVRMVYGVGTDNEKVEDLPLHAIDQNIPLGWLSSLFIPPLSQSSSFESFQEIIAQLRAPDGCPWDRKQTHISLRPFLLEEAYETLDALDRSDMRDLQEELGDLLLQIVLHAQIATEDGDFNMHQVLHGIGSKLIRRHPHVFSNVEVEDVSGVIRTWEAIKAEERQENGEASKQGLLDGVPRALPALLQAEEVIERVGRVGFDRQEKMGKKQVVQKLLQSVMIVDEHQREETVGELLLAVASMAHSLNINAESALREAVMRFRVRFGAMESRILETGESMVEMAQDKKAKLWRTLESDELRSEET